jgi:eukaryotic-like serine/threonine-protein kinase
LARVFLRAPVGPVDWRGTLMADTGKTAGQSLAHYRILEPLGKGGMGEVFLAQDTRLERRVAIKVLHADVAADTERRRRFLREARAAAAISHPNVAQIHEIGQVDGTVYLAFEYIEGETVSARMKRGPLPWEEQREIALQVAAALEEAHAKGIVHRDVKPANIMIDARGCAKVLDFGLAKQTARDVNELQTQRGLIMGTVSYMSPEQALGEEIDTRSDIFSLGVVLYEMATRRRPFDGSSEMQTLAKILQSSPEPFRDGDIRHPEGYEALVRKCLEKRREDRFATATELIASLKQIGQPAAPAAAPEPGKRRLRAFALAGLFGLLLASGWQTRSVWLGPSTPAPEEPSTGHSTAKRPLNPDAHQWFLRARFHIDKSTQEGLRTGREYLQKAIEIDPSYADAYVGLAEAYMVAAEWFMSPLEALPKAKAAARKALELDSGSIAACVALGQTLALYDHDWPAAEKEFNEALAAAPEDARVRAAYAHLLLALNRLDDAIREGAKAVELDPIQPLTSHTLGLGYLLSKQHDKAVSLFDQALEVDPNYWLAHSWKGWSQLYQGNVAAAIETLRKADQIVGIAQTRASCAYAEALNGKPAGAQALVKELTALRDTQYVPADDILILHLALNNRAEALDWLEKAVVERNDLAFLIRVDPRLDPLRTEPRFQQLLDLVHRRP